MSGQKGRGPRRRWTWLAAWALASAALAAGCGGDDDAAGGGGAGGQTGAGEASGIVAEAQQVIDEHRAPIEWEAPGPPVDASKLSGKTVAIVSVDERVPILGIANRFTRAAAREVGIETTLFDAQSRVNRMQQGLQQAIRDADAIVLTGIPLAAVEGPLQEAKEKGIPTVSVLNNQPKTDAPGQGAGELVYATSSPDYELGGALVAAKAIVDTDGKANVEIFDTKEITPSKDVVAGMKSLLDRCQGCKVSTNTTPLAEWATALTGKAQSVIRANPNIDYLLPIFDDMGIFLTAGVRQAAADERVNVASFDGTPAALKLIQDGDIFTADPGQPPGWVGWHVLDQAMRGMLDMEPSDPVIPLRFLDDEILSGLDAEDVDAPYGNPKYREGFLELWGVTAGAQ